MTIRNKEKGMKQKKLVLNKETLKDLTARGAGKVIGGAENNQTRVCNNTLHNDSCGANGCI